MSDWLSKLTGAANHVVMTRFAFLRCLGCIYLVSFCSLFTQATGLIGENGILPIAGQLAGSSFLSHPGLFWLNTGNGMINLLCLLAIAAGLLLMAGIAQRAALIVLWIIQLSFVSAGGVFLDHPADRLLLEAGLLAILLAPSGWRPRRPSLEPLPPMAAVWLLRLLLFKVLFSSGLDRIGQAGDAWRDMSSMNLHYLSQPLPSWVSWHVQQFRPGFHEFTCWAMAFVEIVAALYIFSPRKTRLAAGGIILLQQAYLCATGNMGVFNLLMASLALLVLDDGICPLAGTADGEKNKAAAPPWLTACAALLALTVLLSVRPLGPHMGTVLTSARAVGTGHVYDTWTSRHEDHPAIVVEGSLDGSEWREYEFAWRPQDIMVIADRMVPHLPRLDWRMELAAREPYDPNSSWTRHFFNALLEGREDVLALLGKNPFEGKPPLHLRAQICNYAYTDIVLKEIQEKNNQPIQWWERKPGPPYLKEVLQLKR